MKKISTLLFALLLTGLAFAQTRTLQPVTYRGAFEPNAARWTDGWTNFAPNAVKYDSIQATRTTTTVSAAITKNTTWLANRVYVLNGPIYVKTGATLTIQPGCIIRGNANVSNSCLIVSRGGKINAVGTTSNPIVFTSSKADGQRNLGDWGGVIILGKARINAVGGVSNIEGLAASTDNEFGGTDDEDNSGSFAYCRIEFGGYIFSPDKEINGLTMGGVGRKTRIDHVQVSFVNDDAFEWFGGTVNCSHLVAYQNLDDDLDTDLGYSGTVQFGLVIRNKNYFDPSNNSTSEGFESDNDPDGSSNSITPRTNAVFCNITLVGPYRNDTTVTISSKFQRALRIRRASNLRVYNSVFTDFPNGLHFDGDRTAENSLATDPTGASAACRYNVFATIKNKSTNPPTTSKRPIQTNSRYTALIGGVTSAKLDSLFDAWNNTDFGYNSNGLFADNINQSNFDMDYRPGASSPLATGANFTDAFIEPRTRIGLGAVNISQDTIEIGNISSATAVVLNVGSIANANDYIWTLPAKGVTIVSGQNTTTLTINFDDPAKFATTIAKPAYIYCQARNNASLTLSTLDSVRISKTKPNFSILALTSNANNNLADGFWTSTASASAASQRIVNVASTTGLRVGAVVKIIPGTGAGAIGTNNTVDSIINGTSFRLKTNITTAIVANVVLKAYYFPQGTSTIYTSATGATSAGTLVTVGSTTNLKEGMLVVVTAGIGTLKAGTVVSKIISATQFNLSLIPTVALSGGNSVISGYPMPINTCPITVSNGFTSEVDFTVVAPNASNILGYRFDAPTSTKPGVGMGRVSRVGSNLQTDYKTNRLAFVLTSANNVGMVFDSTFVSGTIKVTPYNNAGLGKAFSIKVSKLNTGIFKVTSSGAAIKNTTVIYTAQLSNGDNATSYKWTIPANVTALSGSVSGLVVTTTTDTLSLAFGNLFKSGSLRVEAINACGTGKASTFTLNGTTTLTKNGTFELAEENSEIELDYSLNVYPNPSNGSFKVALNTESTSNATVSVLNLLGQVVYTTEVENNNGLIYTEINKNFEKGVYLVKVSIENETKVNKMIVE